MRRYTRIVKEGKFYHIMELTILFEIRESRSIQQVGFKLALGADAFF